MTDQAEPERRGFQRTDGTQSYLAWDDAGDAAPVLVFAHANGFNAQTYRRILAPLADRMTILALDMRGHGFTDLPADPATQTSWHRYADDLLTFIDGVVPEGRPLIMAGHSMGGTSSLLALGRRPERAQGLVLIDPVILPRFVYWMLPVRRLLGLGPRRIRLADMALARRAVWPDTATMVRAYTGRGAFKTWPAEIIRDYVEGGTRPHRDGGIELACAPAWEAANFANYDHNIWPPMSRLTCPVTLVRGTVGSTCPLPMAVQMRWVIKGLDDRPVEGASHFVPMEAPDRVREAILARAVTGSRLD